MTPAQYISERRLELAGEQLLRKKVNIAEIAEKTGFSDVSYFCKVFKEKYGITPKQYRQTILKNKDK